MKLPLMTYSLAAKLAAVVVHADEMLSPDGHALDRVALKAAITDPEVVEFLGAVGPLAPVKRAAAPTEVRDG